MDNQWRVKIEQLRRAFLYFASLKKRRLTSVGIHTTTRCNGRCRTCNIWKKKKKVDITIKAVKSILTDETPSTQYFLSGGEVLLHPEYEKILELFKDKNFILLSNGILADKLIKTVKKFRIKRVVLSFDGVGKTYERVRGVDNFENLHRLLHQLKEICTVSLNFTINPLNNKKEEILKADRFAKNHGVYLALGIYNNPEYFDTTLPMMKIPNLAPLRSYPLNQYLSLYNQWLKGKLFSPCLSIRNSCTILPNGDVSLCEGKNIILGNLNQRTLKEIWENPKTQRMQDKFLSCNDCWLICQKPMDIVSWNLIKLIPKKLLPDRLKEFSPVS